MGTVNLACSAYEMPPIIADVAADLPEEMWNRECHASVTSGWRALFVSAPEVNNVTYNAPDYMLSSAQDYRPGEKGDQEHIWQAT